MPQFPRHESERQLTTQQPSVLAAGDSQGAILEKTAEVAGKATDLAVKWANAVDTIQTTTAKANLKGGLADILARAEADPDYNAHDKYAQEIDKLRMDSGRGFASKAAEANAGIEFDYDAKIAKIQLGATFKKKMVNVGQAATLKLLDMEVTDVRPDFEKRIIGILGKQVAAEVYGPKEAYELQQKYVKQGKYNAFLIDLNNDPAAAEENLKKNTYGLDVSELEKARNLHETESKKIQATTENALLEAYLTGQEIPTDQIKQLLAEGKIDAKFAESMISKLNNPKPDTLSQDATYIDFQNRVMEIQAKGDKAFTEEIVGLMSDVMQAHSKGLLDKADVERILKDRNELVQRKLEKVAEDVMGEAQPKTFLERLSFWSDEYADKKPEIKARMYRKLIDGLMQKKDGTQVMKKVISDEIETQMAGNLLKPDRQYAVNPETKQRIHSDDGGATWKDESGKDIQ